MGPFARIFLRYVAGAFLMKAIGSVESVESFIADPDVIAITEAAFGLALAAGTEWWYALARKWGWSK